MKSKLSLNNPLWSSTERRQLLDKVVQQSAAELEAKIKQKLLNPEKPPAGKIYRRGGIYKKGLIRDRKLNRTRFKRKFFSLYDEKFAVAYSFHRASRKGQPPATDTGALANSIRAKRSGEMHATVATSKNYGAILDDPNKLDRPFFRQTAEEFKAKFKQNIREAIGGNSAP